MHVRTTTLADVLIFEPTPFVDDRGFFTRTFDTQIFDEAIVAHTKLVTKATDFKQDSQSRSGAGTIRGLHGRRGAGEAKLVRCAHGSITDILVDIRETSSTFGQREAFILDDVTFSHLFVPPGFLHGFQVTSTTADVCYRIDRLHDPKEDIAVRFDDSDLAIAWPAEPGVMSARDLAAGSYREIFRS